MGKRKATEVKKPTQFQITGEQTIPPIEGFPVNPNLPTHHVDIVNFQFSNDGLTMISFFSRTPGRNVEECRVSFSNTLAKKIVDLVCQHLHYYPQSSAQVMKEKKG